MLVTRTCIIDAGRIDTPSSAATRFTIDAMCGTSWPMIGSKRLEAGFSTGVDNRVVERRSDFGREHEKRIVLQKCEIDLFESGSAVTLRKGDHYRLLREPARLQLAGTGRHLAAGTLRRAFPRVSG
jgi:hypothetical protein